MDEDIVDPPKPKTDLDKSIELQQGITQALEKALGKPLDATQREEVSMLVGDVVRADKNGLGMDKLLDSLTNATGLKSYQIGPVVDLMSNFHPKDSDQANFIKGGVETFQAAHENDKRLDLQQGITKELEKALGKPLDATQREEVSMLVGDVVRADKNGLGMDKLLDSLT
ncbi:MAG: hypothetical protein J0L79_05340, partial [Rickettsiales bacterium]|nr:hypothetical protein [Rickettsiales bacterium]